MDFKNQIIKEGAGEILQLLFVQIMFLLQLWEPGLDFQSPFKNSGFGGDTFVTPVLRVGDRG